MFLVGVCIGAVGGTVAGLFVWDKLDSMHWDKKTKESHYRKKTL